MNKSAINKTEIFNYLEYLKVKNGPEKEDYRDFDKIIKLLSIGYKKNEITESEIQKIIRSFSSDFFEKTLHGHVLLKPFGYAGDFMIIDKIYTIFKTENQEYLNWDKYFQNLSGSKAVRNRKEYFKELIADKAKQKETLNMLNLASGSGRDMFEFYQTQKNGKVKTTCIEMDKNAIEYAKKLNNDFLSNITFIQQNIFRFKTDKQYDIIWSAGLFDYFDDKTFVRILSRLKNNIRPKGEIIIGNFSPNNPSRDYMEIFGEWFLHHRTEEELINLAQQAGFNNKKISIKHEPEKVNLFLHIKNQEK